MQLVPQIVVHAAWQFSKQPVHDSAHPPTQELSQPLVHPPLQPPVQAPEQVPVHEEVQDVQLFLQFAVHVEEQPPVQVLIH